MSQPTLSESLAGYFRFSGQFYYVLTDSQGKCVWANELFRKQFPYLQEQVPMETIFSETGRSAFYELHRQCMGGVLAPLQAALTTATPDGTLLPTQWELTPNYNSEGLIDGVQMIGYPSPLNGHPVQLPRQGEIIPERYKAYEDSAEGLWMFDLRTPVAAGASTGAIIEHFRLEGYLAECNDNLARMYGYTKADEMIGTPLDRLIDFDEEQWVNHLYAFITNGFVLRGFETRETDRNGRSLYFLNNMTGIVEDGLLKRVWGTQQNITEQRHAEYQLKQSELFYRNLISDSLDAILLADERGVISFGSPSVTPLLGHTPEDLVGHSLFEFVHPEDVEMSIAAFEDEVEMRPRVKFINIRLLKKSGDWLWSIVRGHNMLYNPYVAKVVIYFYDDTPRKMAEAALHESQKDLHTQAMILNNVTDVILTTDMNMVITSWNSVLEKLSGVTADEAMGRLIHEVMLADPYPYSRQHMLDTVFTYGVWKGEISFIRKDGEKKYLLHTISILYDERGEPKGMLGVGKDITERKEIETRLQESELFYRNMISHSLDGILLADAQGVVTYCGPSVTKLSGYEPEHLLGRSLFEFVHPEDTPLAFEAFSREVNSNSYIDHVLIRLKHSNQSWVWCSVRGHNQLHHPVVKAVIIYFTDDTRRKEAEDKLRKNEQQFRSLIYNLKQGVIVQNEKGEMIICNHAALEMLDVTEEQLLGKTPFDPRWKAIYEDGRDFPRPEQPVSLAMTTKKSVNDVVMGVYRPGKNDWAWLLLNAEPVLDANGDVINVICSFADISEQKRLTRELHEQEMQQQKLLTQATIDGQEKERQEIGKELHDNINQHLTTTRLYLEVAREKAQGEALEMINLSHKNLADIINEIRNLSQSLVPATLGDLGLVESVHDLCDALQRAHTFSIEFFYRHFNEDNMPGNLKLMLFRIIQEQVNNIIRHANATSIRIRLQSDAEHVILTINDDGQGFNLDNYRKGMGFNNISSRAALFNGRLDLEAAPGKGCTLAVTIPVSGLPKGK